jgi:hypothetical protein
MLAPASASPEGPLPTIADILPIRHPQEVIGHVRHISPIYGWG